jgi:pimeloyl-ACP methyl ester carboxylesterase
MIRYLFYSCIFFTMSGAAAQGGPADALGKYTIPQVVVQNAAILIPGSGDQEIDEYHTSPGTTSTYRQIAAGLAPRGINVFQLKKRSRRDILNITETTGVSALTILTLDIEKLISTVKQNTKSECVWLIGHSEGGLFSLLVAQNRHDICGIILAAAAARPMAEVYKEQIHKLGLSGYDTAQIVAAIDAIKRREVLQRNRENILIDLIFNKEAVNIFRDIFNIDPVPLIQKLDVPILYLRGTYDFQISTKDAEIMTNLPKKVVVRQYENLNHVFSNSAGSTVSDAFVDALNSEIEVSAVVIHDMSNFMKTNVARSR